VRPKAAGYRLQASGIGNREEKRHKPEIKKCLSEEEEWTRVRPLRGGDPWPVIREK
jgi:hypothetical protein